MQKQPPSPGRVATMVAFALSCFALLLYLWTSFGGAVPLGAKGYRFDVRFGEATQLADNADVRIAGVNVGTVVHLEPDGRRTRATVEMDPEHAPVPSDARAILRVKTLLGETYVELTPGTEGAEPVPDGGMLADGRVAETTELDEVLRALDPRTRAATRRVVLALGTALEGRGEGLNGALGSAAPLAADGASVLGTLDRQRAALGRLAHDAGAVFEALGRRDGELTALTRTLAALLDTTARRERELEDGVRALPTTLRELRATLVEVEGLAADAAPVVRALRPAGRSLGPALDEISLLAPELVPLFADLDRLAAAAREGLPAGTRVVDRLRPLVRALDPILAEAYPVVDYLGRYPDDIAATFAGGASANQAKAPLTPGGPEVHYLRALVPLSSQALVAEEGRLPSNRHNAYRRPRALDGIATGSVPSFDCRHASDPPAPDPAPPCIEQEPFEFQGKRLRYPHVERDR